MGSSEISSACARNRNRSGATAFGILDLTTAALLTMGVFIGLPARWVPVDVATALLVALETASGVALLCNASWAPSLALGVAALALSLGLGLVTVLAVTASWLAGIYGPIGRGGAALYVLVAALAIPYLVALPAFQLAWARRAKGRA
jgi:hypothetical protein